MSIHVALTHETRYRYDRLATLGPQVVRLRPAPHSRTRILSYALRIEPAGHFLNWQQDPLGNYLARIVVPGKTREFRLQVDLVAEMAVFNPFDFFLEPEAEQYPFAYEPRIAKELEPYLELEPAGPLLTELAGQDRSRTGRNGRLPRRTEPATPPARRLRDPDGAGRADLRGDAVEPERILPRLCLAARADPAAPWARGSFRVGLPDPAQAGRRGTRRAVRHRQGLHRPARLDRGIPARCGLGRPRRHVGPARGRGPHSARVRSAPERRRADHRHGGRGQRRVLVRDAHRPDRRNAARDVPVHRGRMVGDRCARAFRGRTTRRGRRAADDGRRADVRRHRRRRRPGMEHRCARAPQARTGGHVDRAAARPVRAGRPAALRPGQVVSGRVAAALGVCAVLAR